MSELPYFHFVVKSTPQSWPYYVEVPYTAWPDEAMYYNSNGTCRQPYDHVWFYLDVARALEVKRIERTRLIEQSIQKRTNKVVSKTVKERRGKNSIAQMILKSVG